MSEISSIKLSRFLNLIVQKILPNSLMTFIKTWLRQECKDFRLVFIKSHLDADQKAELDNAIIFANELGFRECIAVVDDDQSEVPEARVTRMLKDTSVMPVDKLEVLKLKSKNLSQNSLKNQTSQIQDDVIKPQTSPLRNSQQKPDLESTQPKKPVEKIIQKVVEKVVEKKIQIPVERIVYVQQSKVSNKIACYTCITGSYDILVDPIVVSDNIDYICFSDRIFNTKVWKILPLPKELSNYDTVRKQRLVKILAHRFLKQYVVSIWVDANIRILKDLNLLLDQYDLNKHDFYVRRHLSRQCIYDEARVCIEKKKDSKKTISKHIAKYEAEGYPKDNGLVETGILIRQHNKLNCSQLEDYWAKEVINGSYRDQLSFNYVVWKYKLDYGILESLPKINSQDFFRLSKHTGFSAQAKTNSQPITVALCNYNTTNLTNACIQSMLKNSQLDIFKIIVLDNSDKNPLQLNPYNLVYRDLIEILDNTSGKIIDFNEVVRKYGGENNSCGYANLKHAYSIQYLIDTCQTAGMLLCDSDIVVKGKIDIADYSYLTVGKIQQAYYLHSEERQKSIVRRSRIFPMLQFFNIQMVKTLNIKYFDENGKIIGGRHKNEMEYDTGAFFLEQICQLNGKQNLVKEVEVFKHYINHLCGASWAKIKSEQKFLEKNQKYLQL